MCVYYARPAILSTFNHPLLLLGALFQNTNGFMYIDIEIGIFKTYVRK